MQVSHDCDGDDCNELVPMVLVMLMVPMMLVMLMVLMMLHHHSTETITP